MKKDCMISLCDKTGIMARPWAQAGCMCICVDMQHSIRATRARKHNVERFEGGGEIHFVYGDARGWTPLHFDEYFFTRYRIVFVSAFPVCTNMAGSGSQDYSNKKGRPLKGIPMLMDGLILFNSCEQVAAWSGAPYIVENPVGVIPTHHRKPDYYFQPWYYGDLYTKKTCLWTGNGFVMPEAKYLTRPEGVTEKIWLTSPGEDRANLRSETPEGFSDAIKEANYKLKLAA
jgi:hypothetical protein